MDAHITEFIKKMGKDIKCEACRAFVYLFRNEFNKLNNTGA